MPQEDYYIAYRTVPSKMLDTSTIKFFVYSTLASYEYSIDPQKIFEEIARLPEAKFDTKKGVIILK